MDAPVISNYGYVPFQFFQYVILGLQIYMVYNHKKVNEFLDKYIEDTKFLIFVKKLILSIPLLLVVYYDIRYSSFSFKNLGINPAYNDSINQVLYILGSYAIIQVLAQDSGIKTGVLQRDTVQMHILFTVIAVGMAYSVTKNRSQSLIAILLYYHLKYIVSNNETSSVCFEEI